MRTRLICIAALTVLTSVTSASADIVVWLEPPSPTVNVGESIPVDLRASFEEPVTAWGLDFTIAEPTCAAWIDTIVGENWDATTTLDGDGLAGLRFPTGVSGDVLLATLTFEGVTEGTTALTLTGGTDEDEGFLLEAGVLETNVQFVPGSLTVVPEPAAFSGLAVLGLVALHRRR